MEFEFKLREELGELALVIPIFNRLVSQEKKWEMRSEGDFLYLRVQRCKMYSFLEMNMPIEDDNVKGKWEKSSNESIYISVDDAKISAKISPETILQEVPQEESTATNDLEDNLEMLMMFKLRKDFEELKWLVRVFNIMMNNSSNVHMRVLKQTHLEIIFHKTEKRRPILRVGFGLAVLPTPKWLTRLNMMLLTEEDLEYKFVYKPADDGHRPLLIFKALSR